MSDDASISAIQQRMQQVRCELGHEVEDLVASARDMTDWRKYVRAYPWACLGAAAAAGYLLAPRGMERLRFSSTDLEKLAQMTHVPSGEVSPPVTKRVGSAITKAIAMAAMRGLLAYVGQRMAKTTVENGHGEVPY